MNNNISASYSADLNGHAIRDACEKLNKKLDVIKGTVHQLNLIKPIKIRSSQNEHKKMSMVTWTGKH